MRKKHAREIRTGIILVKYILNLPFSMQTKQLLLFSGLPGDSKQDTLRERAERRTAINYLRKHGK